MRRSTLLTVGVGIVLAGLLAWTSMTGSQVECRVCMTYGGRQECATAAAPDQELALRTATDTACATIAPGRAASLECARLKPDSAVCQ